MTIKIKVKYFNEKCKLYNIDKGDWIDLRASKTVNTSSILTEEGKLPKHGKIPLGIAMELPKGIEALVAPRGSTFKTWKLISSNSIGVIDNSYSGNKDEWHFPYISFGSDTIKEGDRICQFRIQLSQKATFLQKLRWFLSSKIEFIEVRDLNPVDRGGFGSTGKH